MIKVATLGMFDNAKINPTLKSAQGVKNYSFITDDGDLYLIANEFYDDRADKDDVVIPAGEYLNGYLVKAWDAQKLIIDEKHITYGDNSVNSYTDIKVGTSLLVPHENGTLKFVAEAPKSGVYFKVVSKCTLVGNAIEAKVIVVDKDTVA